MENVKNYFNRIKSATLLNLLVKLGDNFGLVFAEYYFRLHGVSLYKLILIFAIGPLVSLPIVYFCNTWNVRRFMRYGILAYMGMALSLLFYNPLSWLIYAVFSGLNLGLFWVSFNYVFFQKSTSGSNGKDYSIYFIIGPLAGIVLPPLGALLVGGMGYRVVFLIATLLFLLPLWYSGNQQFDARIQRRFSDAKIAFKGLRTIEFLSNAMYDFQGNFLTIYVLLFLKSQYQLGGLVSYLAIISMVVSFGLSYVSDKSKKRLTILYPTLTAMAILIMIMPGLTSLAALVVIGGVYAILDNVSRPIRFAIPVDLAEPDIGFWRTSEYYGNIGRTVIFGLAALLLYLGYKWAAFGIFAVITLAFPFIVQRKAKGIRQA